MSQIKIRSTTNGIILQIGRQEPVLLYTTDVAQVIDALQTSLKGCGIWEVDIPHARAQKLESALDK